MRGRWPPLVARRRSWPASTSRARGSAPQHCGAHDPALLRATRTRPRSTRLLDAGDGAVRMVTLAPELPGGLDAVRRLAERRGHRRSRAHRRDVRRGARGARRRRRRSATHLFNAMRADAPPRAGPGAALLEDPDAFVELIADGVHLHPAVLRWAATADAAPLPARHRRDGRGRRPATATTCSGPWRSRCATAWPGWPTRRDRRHHADDGRARCATPCEMAGLPLDDVVRAATATPATPARPGPGRRPAARLRAPTSCSSTTTCGWPG